MADELHETAKHWHVAVTAGLRSWARPRSQIVDEIERALVRAGWLIESTIETLAGDVHYTMSAALLHYGRPAVQYKAAGPTREVVLISIAEACAQTNVESSVPSDERGAREVAPADH